MLFFWVMCEAFPALCALTTCCARSKALLASGASYVHGFCQLNLFYSRRKGLVSDIIALYQYLHCDFYIRTYVLYHSSIRLISTCSDTSRSTMNLQLKSPNFAHVPRAYGLNSTMSVCYLFHQMFVIIVKL